VAVYLAYPGADQQKRVSAWRAGVQGEQNVIIRRARGREREMSRSTKEPPPPPPGEVEEGGVYAGKRKRKDHSY
jgi:hypothetical protein